MHDSFPRAVQMLKKNIGWLKIKVEDLARGSFGVVEAHHAEAAAHHQGRSKRGEGGIGWCFLGVFVSGILSWMNSRILCI